jgi:hypothetical protein
MKIGEALLKEGLITKEELNLALERQVILGGRVGTNLLELRILNEEEFTNFLGKYCNLPAVSNEIIDSIPEEVLHSLNKEIIEKYKILPLKKEDKKLHVAMLNARDVLEVDELSFITGFNIIPHAVSELRLLYALERYYGIKTDPRYIRFMDRFDPDIEVSDSIIRTKEALTNVKDAEEIAEILLRGASRLAPRVAIFRVSKEEVIPWKAKGLGIEKLEEVKEKLSIFSEAIKSKKQLAPLFNNPEEESINFYTESVHNTQGNTPLIKLSIASRKAFIMTVATRERVVAFLYADNGDDFVLDANVPYLLKLVSMVSIAFEILILKKRILKL